MQTHLDPLYEDVGQLQTVFLNVCNQLGLLSQIPMEKTKLFVIAFYLNNFFDKLCDTLIIC